MKNTTSKFCTPLVLTGLRQFQDILAFLCLTKIRSSEEQKGTIRLIKALDDAFQKLDRNNGYGEEKPVEETVSKEEMAMLCQRSHNCLDKHKRSVSLYIVKHPGRTFWPTTYTDSPWIVFGGSYFQQLKKSKEYSRA